MKIILQGTRVDLTPSIRKHVDDQIGSIEKLLTDKQSSYAQARVEIGRPSEHHRKGDVYYAEVNLRLGSRVVRATESHNDVRTALDMVRDEIKRQLRKSKTKEASRSRRAVRRK